MINFTKIDLTLYAFFKSNGEQRQYKTRAKGINIKGAKQLRQL
jgi:hypothetical protein